MWYPFINGQALRWFLLFGYYCMDMYHILSVLLDYTQKSEISELQSKNISDFLGAGRVLFKMVASFSILISYVGGYKPCHLAIVCLFEYCLPSGCETGVVLICNSVRIVLMILNTFSCDQWLSVHIFFCFCLVGLVLVVLGFEHRASCLLGKTYSFGEMSSQILCVFFFF